MAAAILERNPAPRQVQKVHRVHWVAYILHTAPHGSRHLKAQPRTQAGPEGSYVEYIELRTFCRLQQIE